MWLPSCIKLLHTGHLTLRSQRFPSHRYSVGWKLSRHGMLAVTSSVCDSNGARSLYLPTVTNLIYAGCIPRFQGSNAPLRACLKYNNAISWHHHVASSCHVWRLHHDFQTHSLLLVGVLLGVPIIMCLIKSGHCHQNVCLIEKGGEMT